VIVTDTQHSHIECQSAPRCPVDLSFDRPSASRQLFGLRVSTPWLSVRAAHGEPHCEGRPLSHPNPLEPGDNVGPLSIASVATSRLGHGPLRAEFPIFGPIPTSLAWACGPRARPDASARKSRSPMWHFSAEAGPSHEAFVGTAAFPSKAPLKRASHGSRAERGGPKSQPATESHPMMAGRARAI
jgi:hypothetical protein